MKDLTFYILYKHGDKRDKHHKQVEEIESWMAESTIMKYKAIWNHLKTDFHCEYWREEDIKFSQDLKIYVYTDFYFIRFQVMTYRYFPL
jgi:ribonucleotide reductase beta subunit family protein with ferritin-like domain